MKTLRLVLSIVTALLFGLGYAGSQFAALRGDAANWATRVDSKPVAGLAAVLLATGIALSLVRDREEQN